MKTKRIISIFLLLAMLLSLAACRFYSKNQSDDDDDDEEIINGDFEGKYQGKLDLVRVLNTFILSDEDISFSEDLQGKRFATVIIDIRETTFDISISCKTSTLKKFIEDYYEAYARNRFSDKTELESALNDINDERINKIANRVETMFGDMSKTKIVYEFDGESSLNAEFPYKTIEFQLELGTKTFTIKGSDDGFYDLWLTDIAFKKTANLEEKDDVSSENIFSGICSDDISSDVSSDTDSDDSSEPSDDTNNDVDSVWAGFGNEIKNFGGETINILGYIGEFQYDSCQVDTEYTTGDPVNDAFHERNSIISSRLGLNIVRIIPEDNDDMINKFINSTVTGVNDYHALVAPLYFCTSFVTDGLLYDIKGLNNPYLHLEMPWWDQNLMSDITLNDKVYFITGDALVSDDESTYAMLFNKDIIADNGDISCYIMEQTNGGDIYDLVKSGRWTLDTMYNMIQLVVNPTVNYAFDDTTDNIWGMVGQGIDFLMLMEGMEQKMVVKGTDADDREVPVLRISSQENYMAFNNLCNVFYDEGHVAISDHYGAPFTEKREVFAAGKALFMPDQMAYIGKEVLKNTDVNYGILPMPKRDSAQSNYTTSVQVFHCAVISIPITCVGQKLDATCYALEAMAFLGKKLVRSEYYERILQRKNGQDAESSEMLELIFENKTYDMGAVFNFNAGDFSRGTIYFYPTIIYTRGNTNLLSTYDKLSVIFQIGIDAFVNKCYAD